jgi:hypothetical protein
MKHTTKRCLMHMARVRIHGLVILSCLVLALLGHMPESSGGWLSWPPGVTLALMTGPSRRERERQSGLEGDGWHWIRATWRIPLARGLALRGLWLASGRWELGWISGVPWLVWLWQTAGWVWPGLRRQPEWQGVNWSRLAGRLAWVGGLGLLLGRAVGEQVDDFVQTPFQRGAGATPLALGLGCVVCGREGRWVNVERQADGSYRAELCGHFNMSVAGDDPFRIWLLWLFLRWLEEPGRQRRGGRTQDGRAPFVSQVQIAEWFDLPQPNVSRIEGYWRTADWANLLSLKSAEVLTVELRERIVAVFATFPWWTLLEVYEYLRQQGVAVTYEQVRQAAQESGWRQLRETLAQRYHFSAGDFRPRDGWLVKQLLAMQEQLLAHLEALEGLTPEDYLAVDEVRRLAVEVGVAVAPSLKALPWMLRVEQVLFGDWQAVEDDRVRCIYCGSTHVVRKSQQPCLKWYYDAEGQLQSIEVYRYYCRNQACDKGSFTNLPPGLVPYSRYRTEVKVRALQMSVARIGVPDRRWGWRV